MATKLKDISDKVDDLQIALDAEQQQVADLLAEKETTIATLNETIATLQASIADGGTGDERQAVLDKLLALKTDLESTATPSTPPVEPGL